MHTRRYPRTLQEAFGPYATGPIIEPKATGYSLGWWAAMSLCAACAVAAIFF